MARIGFDNDQYIKMQSGQIANRIAEFGGKLYMEFGGKLFDDHHASRVLPGFQPDSKLRMLLELKDEAEIVIAISAIAIDKQKSRGDLNIPYDREVLRLIDLFRGVGLYVGSVVITQYSGQASADAYRTLLRTKGIKVFTHYEIDGYPTNVPLIVSEEGYGRNDYIETERSLVVVTAPGPGSGKMATCLSQLYHENKRGVKAGYAKFETFPIWNLPLKHPVNLAYEAATADLNDVNMIDPFHLEAYGVPTVNYNRDVEIFPVLNTIFEKIYGLSPYKSPTDMGVNMVGKCIVDNDAVCDASRQEIIRRYYQARCEEQKGKQCRKEIEKIEKLMSQAGFSPALREVATVANSLASETGNPVVALALPDGRTVTGKTKSLVGASAAALLNALKLLADIPDQTHLLSASVIEPVQDMKVKYLGNANPRLHLDEILVALSVCAASDENARRALECLPLLAGSEAHSSVILASTDSSVFRKLKVNLTCEPQFQTKKLYHS